MEDTSHHIPYHSVRKPNYDEKEYQEWVTAVTVISAGSSEPSFLLIPDMDSEWTREEGFPGLRSKGQI